MAPSLLFLNKAQAADQLCTSTSVTMAKTISFSSMSTHAYGSPKGEKAIEVARRGSVPKKTRDNTDWSVKGVTFTSSGQAVLDDMSTRVEWYQCFYPFILSAATYNRNIIVM